jgi:hypothetical protein
MKQEKEPHTPYPYSPRDKTDELCQATVHLLEILQKSPGALSPAEQALCGTGLSSAQGRFVST